MDDFEDDPLWELLGRSPRAEASAYFARKVLKAIREKEKRPRFTINALLRWFIPAAASAALLIGWSVYRHEEQDTFDAIFDSAADLQSLVAAEDTSVWLDGGSL
ncbi:MAG TPA: hypothetical protein VMS23_06775 [Terrimicrobiaceae bacterium]|nr:hypothetical protein [Terrimicrobiaceae bacterium]